MLPVHEAITLAIAVLGAVLGIVNIWHQLSKDKVRLLVRPAHALLVGGLNTGEWTISIEVINLSGFPLTVHDVGLEFRDGERLIAPDARTTQRGSFPVRLDSRESLTVLLPAESRHHERLGEVRRAFARCQCGTVRYGTSKALKQMISEASKKQ